MVDLTEQEKAAIRAAMKPVAEIMEEIGWQARFSDLSEAQVLTLIEVARHRHDQIARVKNPPVHLDEPLP